MLLPLYYRSATGCVAHGLGFLPTTSHTRDDDETRRIDGSVHDVLTCITKCRAIGLQGTGRM